MRRVWVVIASAVLVAGVGCGKKSYEERLVKTLEKMDYDRRLKKNLMAAPKEEKKFTELSIYVRAPKEEALTKAGQLPVTEGQFDLDASFVDSKEANATLHVLARVKMPKKPPAKGAAPVAAPPARAEFVPEVLRVLSDVFGSPEALQTPKFADETRPKSGNKFKRLIFPGNDKEVKLYTYKQGNHEVALIFVYDPKIKNQIAAKIEYSLDSFATGEKATLLYSGGTVEEVGDTGPAGPM
jgi:hypothetical protein